MSFMQYVDNLKIENAKKKLLKKENIELISIELGFSHQTRFYRKFKESVGMTPKEYRNTMLEKIEHI